MDAAKTGMPASSQGRPSLRTTQGAEIGTEIAVNGQRNGDGAINRVKFDLSDE